MKIFRFENNSAPDNVILQIAEIAASNKTEAYIVGGYVRDRLLGKASNDIDITVIGDAIKFAEIVSVNFHTELSAVYKKFGTALLMVSGNMEHEIKIEIMIEKGNGE